MNAASDELREDPQRDTPTRRRSDWIVTIDGRGGFNGIPRDEYAYTCRDMTPSQACAAAIAEWELKHCPSPDDEGDILEDWRIYGIRIEQSTAILPHSEQRT